MVNPVTVKADVAVKRASHKPTLLLEQNGVAKTSVPRIIINKPVTTVN